MYIQIHTHTYFYIYIYIYIYTYTHDNAMYYNTICYTVVRLLLGPSWETQA